MPTFQHGGLHGLPGMLREVTQGWRRHRLGAALSLCGGVRCGAPASGYLVRS